MPLHGTFRDVDLQLTQSTLTYEYADGPKLIQNNVSFQIKGAGQFELLSADKEVLQVLSLTGAGSDGMSDRVYPYEVQDIQMGLQSANGGVGGCTSNFQN